MFRDAPGNASSMATIGAPVPGAASNSLPASSMAMIRFQVGFPAGETQLSVMAKMYSGWRLYTLFRPIAPIRSSRNVIPTRQPSILWCEAAATFNPNQMDGATGRSSPKCVMPLASVTVYSGWPSSRTVPSASAR